MAAKYPTSAAGDNDLYIAVNQKSTTLTDNPLAAGAVTVNVVDASAFPSNGAITIDAEIIRYTGKTATSFTGCTRGFDGTSDVQHSVNTPVYHRIIADHHNTIKDEIKAVENDLVALQSALNDADTPASTASDVKDRLDQIVSQLKLITGEANWYSAPDTTISALNTLKSEVESCESALDDADTPASTATDIKDRLDQIVSEIKLITGGTNWYDTVTNDLTELLPLSGGTMTGNIAMSGTQKLTGLVAGSTNGDSVRYEQVVFNTGDQSISGNKTFSDQITTPKINNSGVWGFRNRIINGLMKIDQRNVGTSINGDSGGSFVVDRFRVYKNNTTATYTAQRSTTTPPTGFTHYINITVTANDANIDADELASIIHSIEGNNVSDLLFGSTDAKTITLSFWVRSSLTGTFSGSLRNDDSNRSYPFIYIINSANVWEKKSITINGDTTGTWNTTTGVGVSVIIDLGSGPNLKGTAGVWSSNNYLGSTGSVNLIGTNGATFDITGLQFEVGSQATEFEYRPIQVELQLCQRYFWKSFAPGVVVAQNSGSQVGCICYRVAVTGATANGQIVWFPTQMRTTPTITYYNPNAANSNWRNSSDAADSGASSSTAAGLGQNSFWANNAQVAGDAAGEFCIIHATAFADI